MSYALMVRMGRLTESRADTDAYLNANVVVQADPTVLSKDEQRAKLRAGMRGPRR